MTPQEAAEYIASLLKELTVLAQHIQVHFWLMEAEAQRKGQGSRPS